MLGRGRLLADLYLLLDFGQHLSASDVLRSQFFKLKQIHFPSLGRGKVLARGLRQRPSSTPDQQGNR